MNKELKMKKTICKNLVRQLLDLQLVESLRRVNKDQSSSQQLKTMRVDKHNSESNMEVIRPNNRIITIQVGWKTLFHNKISLIKDQLPPRILTKNNKLLVEISSVHHQIQVKCKIIEHLLWANNPLVANNIKWIGKDLPEVLMLPQLEAFQADLHQVD